MERLIEDWIAEASLHASPRATYLILPVAKITANRIVAKRPPTPTQSATTSGTVATEDAGEIEFRGAIDQFLAASHLVAVFIATAGNQLEQLASQLMAHGETLPSLIVSAVATERAKAAMSATIDQLRARTQASGLVPTWPYSPGYCGMDLTQQRPLFDLFDGQTAGVTLTSECLMVPLKSVSGLVGLALPEHVQTHGSPCQRCGLVACTMRRPSR